MSASRSPTFQPIWLANATARFTGAKDSWSESLKTINYGRYMSGHTPATVDLPTPPFPEATATTCFTSVRPRRFLVSVAKPLMRCMLLTTGYSGSRSLWELDTTICPRW